METRRASRNKRVKLESPSPPPPRGRLAIESDASSTSDEEDEPSTANAGASHHQESPQPDDTLQPWFNLPICDLELPQRCLLRGFQWNETGQAFVLTETLLYILTPALGYHPLLKPNQATHVDQRWLFSGHSSPTTAPSMSPESSTAQTPKPTDLFACSFQSQTASMKTESDDTQDFTLSDSASHNTTYTSAAWSPAGLAINESCLLAVLDSESNLKIIGPSANPLTAPWRTTQVLDVSEGYQADGNHAGEDNEEHPDDETDEETQLADASQAVCMAWSPALGSTGKLPVAALLVVGTGSGEVVLWHYSSATHKFSKACRRRIGRSAVTAVGWAPFAYGQSKHSSGPSLELAVAVNDIVRHFEVHVTPGTSVSEPTFDVITREAQPPPLDGDDEISMVRVADEGYLWVHTAGRLWAWNGEPGLIEDAQDQQTLPVDLPEEGDWSPAILKPLQGKEDHFDRDAPTVFEMICGEIDVVVTLESGLEYVPNTSPWYCEQNPIGVVGSLTSASARSHQRRRAPGQLRSDGTTAVENSPSIPGYGIDPCRDFIDWSFWAARLDGIVEQDRDLSPANKGCKVSLTFRARRSDFCSPLDVLEYTQKDLHWVIESSSKNLNGYYSTPIHVFRPVVALYYTCTAALRETLLLEMVQAHAAFIESSKAKAKKVSKGESECKDISNRRKYWFCKWLQRVADEFKPWSAELKEAMQILESKTDMLLVRELGAWLGDRLQEIDTAKHQLDNVERNYIKRIVAVACWLERHVVTQARSDDEAVLQELRAGIDKLTVRTHHARMDPEDVTEWRAGQSVHLKETCPSCKTTIPFSAPSYDADSTAFKLPDTAQCNCGHNFRRCCLTFEILTSSVSASVGTCEGCWAKRKQPLDVVATNGLDAAALRTFQTRCMFCGCKWLSAV